MRFQQTSHIFNSNDIGTSILQFFCHFYIVIKIVFRTIAVKDIACVAQCNFSNLILIANFINSNLHIVKAIQAIKYAEYVDTIFSGQLNEITNYIIRIGCITNGISTANQHLKQCIRHFFTEHTQTFPWIFVQEAIRYVKCCTAPTF